jgi:hypothetical protein
MTDIFAVETPTRTVGLAVRADTGFCFYASDQAFAGLEGRHYGRLEDLQAEIGRVARTPNPPARSQRSGRHRR